jgi:nucleotide-binding universal stress UspA family protein
MEPFAPGVLHPTDFTEASHLAFAHALAISLAQKARLTLINAHSDSPTVEDWQKFPSVRGTLERWGLLEAGSDRSEVFEQLSVKVKKVSVDDSPAAAIAGYLGKNPNDLIVLSTSRGEGLPVFLRDSIAQKVHRASGIDALFVPEGVKGFVSPEDGALSLHRILVPVDHTPSPKPALDAAGWAAHWLGDAPGEIRLFHVGADFPEVDESTMPDLPAGFELTRATGTGDPVDAILAEAERFEADLVVMSTDGRDGFLDLFRGSHSERVVRGAPCAVAAIDATSA